MDTTDAGDTPDAPPPTPGTPPSGPAGTWPPPPPAWLPSPAPGGAWPPVPPAAPPGRRRVLVPVVVAGGVLVVAAAVAVPLAVRSHRGGGSPASSSAAGVGGAASSDPAALYRQALSAVRASAGVHYVAVTSGGAATQRIVGDAGRDSGTQEITFTSPFGTERFTLRLLAGVVYFQGNAPALEDQLGVPAARASGMGGTWVSVSKGDGPYSVVAPGITVADQATQMPLTPSSTRPATSGGHTVTRVLGRVPPQQGAPEGTGHLDVDDSTHLPTAYTSTVTDGVVTLTGTTTFSSWGTAPSVSAPDGAVAWSTLGASPPPGGYGGGGLGPTPTPQVV